jgi:hypothetical protein
VVHKERIEDEETYMISVRRKHDGSYELVNGHMRLKVQLDIHGQAEVIDIGTGQTLHVHEVGGHLLALSDEAQANVDDLALSTINRARG